MSPHTPEQRSAQALCGRKRKDGTPCRAFAGQGTEHPGRGPCKFHGGSFPTVKHHYELEAAEERAATLGAPIEVSPDGALLGLLRASAGHVAWLGAEVAQLNGIASPEGSALVRVYGEERERLARVAKMAIDSGLTQRQVDLEVRQTETIARAITSALEQVGGLSTDQRRQFAQGLRMELAMLSKSAERESDIDQETITNTKGKEVP